MQIKEPKIFMVLLTGMLAVVVTARAQQGFHVGGQWGPHLSSLMNSDDKNNPDFEYQTTWRGAFALNTQYGFTPHTGLGLSCFYSFQGQHYRLAGTELFKRVEYIKVPLLIVYSYHTTNWLMAIYKIGPQLSFLTHARMTDNSGNDLVPDQIDAYHAAELGAMASAGLGIEIINRVFLDLSLHADYGFTNAENNNHNSHINEPVIINNGNGHSISRAATHSITGGANIGIRYFLGQCCSK